MTRAAWLVILATVVVRVVGLLKEVVVAGSFGVGPAMDAFNVAIAIPYLLAGVVVPAISGAVVPLAAAAELRWGRGTERTRRFWGTLLLVTFLMLLGAVLLADLLSFGLGGLFRWLSKLMGGSFDADLQVPLIRSLVFIVTPLALLAGAGQPRGEPVPHPQAVSAAGPGPDLLLPGHDPAAGASSVSHHRPPGLGRTGGQRDLDPGPVAILLRQCPGRCSGPPVRTHGTSFAPCCP